MSANVAHVIELDERNHRYTVDGVFKPSVTQVLEAAGLIDLEGIPDPVLKQAQQRGTRVHQAARLVMLDQLDWASVAPAIGGYVRALDSWKRHTGFIPDAQRIEQTFYCEKYDYCGTPDAVGTYEICRVYQKPVRVRVVVDWKTGNAEAVRYQLAAYAFAMGVRHRAAVRLNADGKYGMSWFKPETLGGDLDVFLRALDRTRNDERFAA